MRPQVHEREAAFHDQWARESRPEDIPLRQMFEGPAALENHFILSRMGDLEGKSILDIGAGLGESSVYFASCGAAVTSLDLSEEMVHFALRLAAFHDVKIQSRVMAAESLGEPDNTFDFVYVANTLHHLTDKSALMREINRVLKPGGWFFSIDPLKYNPVINIYRQMATQVRTVDETPLSFDDVTQARKYFVEVGHREFWIAGLALFLKYYMVNRVHPNADRYWKRIFRETPQSLWWWQPLHLIDEVLTRLIGVRRLAWNMVMWGRKRI